MSGRQSMEEISDVQPEQSVFSGNHSVTSEANGHTTRCGMGHSGFKGLLVMAICCGAPLIILAVLPMLGAILGNAGMSVLSVLALLICPLGMLLMMRIMMRAQNTGTDGQVHPQPVLWLGIRIRSLLRRTK